MPCRLSWLLVEVTQGLNNEYFVIHSVEVIGDINGAYVDRRIRFNQERRELIGIVRLASDDLKIVEMERARLLMAQKSLTSELKPLEANLWCLVHQLSDDSKVQLITVSCKKLVFIESVDNNRKHFMLQKENSQAPVALLHVLDSEQQLLDKMECLSNTLVQNYLCEEKDAVIEAEGLEEAYLLVQYFETRNNLIYTIVHYKDSIFKDENLFRNVVAYISNNQQKTVSQGIILRKSFIKDELTKLLTNIRETCDNVDFRLLNSAKN
ncbi:early boundary activity protein 3 [Eupeodes corollae]|uniref:early boundary activity protein 3 n=1 Tax=Eupeodes corollae TaxID=290404 RepID=UPI0024923198|nr:early boundary activity protein 3 [Eupeodes corollae]